MVNDTSFTVWVFGAMASTAVAVVGYLWTEIGTLNDRVDRVVQTAQVQTLILEGCQKLAEEYINSGSYLEGETKALKSREMFVARGCEKVKVAPHA